MQSPVFKVSCWNLVYSSFFFAITNPPAMMPDTPVNAVSKYHTLSLMMVLIKKATCFVVEIGPCVCQPSRRSWGTGRLDKGCRGPFPSCWYVSFIVFSYPIFTQLLPWNRAIPKSRCLYARRSGTLSLYMWIMCYGPTPNPDYRRARRCSCWHSIIYVRLRNWKGRSSRYKKVVKLLNNIHLLRLIHLSTSILLRLRRLPPSAILLIWGVYAKLLPGIVKDIMVGEQLMDHQRLPLEDPMLCCHRMAG